MIVLGLAGAAGSGKDTVADYLVRRYGFLKFSFSDALYREVAAAFGLGVAVDSADDDVDESPTGEWILRDRATKDTPHPALAMDQCTSAEFADVVRKMGVDVGGADGGRPLSPRQILQWWGTEYRRAQDPDYWIKQADQWIYDVWASCTYPEHRPQLFVNTSVRFPNEREWIHKFTNGQVWHLRREGLAVVNAHVSETPLPVLHDAVLQVDYANNPGVKVDKRCFERELFNNDTVDRLHSGIELLLSTQAKFVRVEPMLPTPEQA